MTTPFSKNKGSSGPENSSQNTKESEKPKLRILVVVLLFFVLIMCFVSAVLLWFVLKGKNEKGKDTTSATSEISSSVASPTTSTTQTTQPVPDTKEAEFSLIGSEQSMYGFTLDFATEVPSDSVIDESRASANGNQFPTVSITGSNYSLDVWLFFEVYLESYTEYKKVFENPTLGEIYRAQYESGYVFYTNDISLDEKCVDIGSGNYDISAPCGSGIISLESNVYFMVNCKTLDGDYTTCDKIMESLEVEVTKL